MATQTTFDTSQILRALGAKTSNAVPSIETGLLIPVVVMGDFSATLAAESVESRGITGGTELTAPGGADWCGFYLQSLSPGGLIIESLDFGITSFSAPNWFRAAEVPWAGGTFSTIFPIGGGTVISRMNRIANEPFPTPVIANLTGGLTFTADPFPPQAFERFWVPPGSFFGMLSAENEKTPVVRFREIPEAQGPP